MIATTRSPYLDLGFHQTPPRIISEIKKPAPTWPKDNFRSRITGELLCWVPSEGRWRAKRVSVRCGQLQIVGNESNSESSLRLALRRLNLTPGPKAYSFALRRTQDSPPVLTLQASNQREFDIWVRTIAIELIRQTPLDAIKYLDILTLTPQLHSTPKAEPMKDCNDNSITNSGIDAQHTFRPKSLDFDHIDENRNYYQTSKTNVAASVVKQSSIDVYTSSSDKRQFHNPSVKAEEPLVKKNQDDEHTVEVLLKKCQNADSYVPVKEKLKLFESLCRLRRIINNDDTVTSNTKRTRSLHDLSNSEYPAPTNTGVKQICKYFETKNDENTEKEGSKFNTIARVNRTNFGPVKTMISRKYSVKIKI